MKGAGAPLDPYESEPFIPACVIGAILDSRSEEGLSLNGINAPLSRKGKSLMERFHAGYVRGEHNECWPWKKCQHAKGYGIIKLNRKQLLVCRVAYHFAWGPIPKKESVLHTCDNQLCVNPNHLYAATKKEQTKRAARMVKERARGERSGNVRATEADVRALRALKGKTLKEMAQEFNLPEGTIQHIRKYRTWTHVK